MTFYDSISIVTIVTTLPHVIVQYIERPMEKYLHPSNTDTYFIVDLNKYYKNILRNADVNNVKQEDDHYAKKIFKENYGEIYFSGNKNNLLLDNGKMDSEIYNNNGDKHVMLNLNVHEDIERNKEMFNDNNRVKDWKLKYEAENDSGQNISDDVHFTEDDRAYGNKNNERNKEIFNDNSRVKDWKPKYETENYRGQSIDDDVHYYDEDFTKDDREYGTNGNVHEEIDLNYYNDVDLTRAENNIDLNRIEKKILRENSPEKRNQSELLKKAKKKHIERVHILNEFMLEHPDSTQYFYGEMERIIKQRVVKDDLRLMITYLQKPENIEIKDKVMCCYTRARHEKSRHADLYKYPTNNLVINYRKRLKSGNILDNRLINCL